ncbi:MAG TPA: PIG-L family deacetylase [Nocardioidaceae bacterium]|jgi:LmbE family N-acetylglucosaminyl deacetylase|nr:PIG-L family deacetylase [Nocardioidaceae bacterium]
MDHGRGTRTVGLLSGVLLVLAAALAGSGCTPAARGPVIFLVPHQDDDVLVMGADVKAQVQAGRRVLLVLLTDGSESGVCYERYGEPRRPVTYQRRHGGLSPRARARCTAQRDAEFVAAARAAGADYVIRADRKQDSCSSPEIAAHSATCTPASTLRAGYVRGVVADLAARYPHASFRAPSYHERDHCSACGNGTQGPGHPDHARTGQGLLVAVHRGLVEDARFEIQPALWPRLVPRVPGHWVHRVVNAPLDAYGTGAPDGDGPGGTPAGHGIGQASVPWFCEQYGGARADPATVPPELDCRDFRFYNPGGADSYVHAPGA